VVEDFLELGGRFASLMRGQIGFSTHNHKNYRDLEAKPLEWQGFHLLRYGIAAHLTAITRDPMAPKGLLRHSSLNTTLLHFIKDVPEVTANGMARIAG
jgi:hypothetical protein